MAKQKFNITQTTGAGNKQQFIPPVPGFQTKPKVIIQGAALKVLKKIFINTGLPEPSDTPEATSRYNTDVYSNIVFQSFEYLDEDEIAVDVFGLRIDLVLMDIQMSKNIVKTVLQGRNGTVKEYISDGDFSVTINGKLYGPGANAYPYDDVNALLSIINAPVAIPVEGDYLKQFNISSLVVESYNMPQEEGIRNYQSFTLNCVSDKELILEKNA